MPSNQSKIDKTLETLDAELAALIQRRLATFCHHHGVPAGELPGEQIAEILRNINGMCRQVVRPCRVAFLGPKTSYSHLALLKYFGTGVELAPVSTIPAVFEEISGGQSDFGVVPIENTTDGGVIDSLEAFSRSPMTICGEVQLPIHHALAANCRREEITEVHSKPQALSQCRHWLARHLPGARLVDAVSTADAARLAHKKPGVAAVASAYAAEVYGLDVLADAIEDNPHNHTRFLVLGREETAKTGRDKTTLMFELPHQAGTLADALAVFKKKHLNLTWIESVPIPQTPGRYLFFVDFMGHRSELRVRRALAALENKTSQLVVLGSYAQAEG